MKSLHRPVMTCLFIVILLFVEVKQWTLQESGNNLVYKIIDTFFTTIMLNSLLIQQAPFVQKVGNTFHWINHYPAVSVVCFVHTRWIEIYPVDSVIQPSNNGDLKGSPSCHNSG